MRSKAKAVHQPITTGNPFEGQIRERRRRLADRKPWMRSAFEKDYVVTERGEDAGKQGSGETAADDRDFT